MKAVILAGGLGTRLAEETELKPKPMVEIGGKPILWHILKHYSHYGMNEFLVALGHRGDVIKRFFLDYAVLRRQHARSARDGETWGCTTAPPRTGSSTWSKREPRRTRAVGFGGWKNGSATRRSWRPTATGSATSISGDSSPFTGRTGASPP